MNILDFAGEVVFLSAWRLIPGPLFLTNLICGTKQGYRAGLKTATGHAIIEFPLVIILTISFSQLANTSTDPYNLNLLGVNLHNHIFNHTNHQYYEKKDTKEFIQ